LGNAFTCIERKQIYVTGASWVYEAEEEDPEKDSSRVT